MGQLYIKLMNIFREGKPVKPNSAEDEEITEILRNLGKYPEGSTKIIIQKLRLMPLQNFLLMICG